ncbi:MAG: glycosyltransferase family 2 protein [Candidatus Curtissbacteria bacterium]
MVQKISVVIPNYNGENLIAKNLPEVIKNCPGCEIIVVDDASGDGSVELLKKFKNIKLIVNPKNLGFSGAVNRGLDAAKGDFILMLNSDVRPRIGFLKPAIEHFKNENVFAVALTDYSHEGGKIVQRGKGGADFKKGFLNHYAANPNAGETLWTSCGSGLFRTKVLKQLGGLDPVYSPFYWEDIDLSFRARQKGYICIFEPASKVDHYHEEGAIKKSRSPYAIKTISYRNQFIFVWKNISDPLFLVEHILWFPHHIARAIISGDTAFLSGFVGAIAKIPQMVQNPQYQVSDKVVSDKDVIKKFKKP